MEGVVVRRVGKNGYARKLIRNSQRINKMLLKEKKSLLRNEFALGTFICRPQSYLFLVSSK